MRLILGVATILITRGASILAEAAPDGRLGLGLSRPGPDAITAVLHTAHGWADNDTATVTEGLLLGLRGRLLSLDSEALALERHPLFARVSSLAQLRTFMEHHVFAVWDFMPLLKALQAAVTGSGAVAWVPAAHPDLVRAVNEMVLAEESDVLPDGTCTSHFELYLRAMREVGADTEGIEAFLRTLRARGLQAALSMEGLPAPSRRFMADTFGVIGTGAPHRVAASFAFGREGLIPGMFESLVEHLSIGPEQAPALHLYLRRHIELDGDEHGPLALKLVEALCDGSGARVEEALSAARSAMASRRRLWDDLLALIDG